MKLSTLTGSNLIATLGKCAILGAGISGLSLGFRLETEGVSCTIFEKEARPGGWIRSESTGDFFFELGPRSLRSQDSAETLKLIDCLGLSSKLLTAPPEAFVRYVFSEGKLQKMPGGFFEALISPLFRPHLLTFIKEAFRKKGSGEDESVFDFFARRFSVSFAEQFIDPFMRGVFAGDCRKLSMRACLPKMVEMEQSKGSLILAAFSAPSTGKSVLYTLEGGLETVIKALAERLDDRLRLSCPVESLKFSQKGIEVCCNGKKDLFNHLFSTLPAHALAPLLPASKLKDLLLEIPFQSVAVVALGYKKSVNPLSGFGYLVPSKENQEILGVVFDSSSFPFQNRTSTETRLTVMLDPKDRNEDECLAIALKSVKAHLGIAEEPDFARSVVACKAIPQYPVGFPEKLKEIKKALHEFPSLSLLGTSYFGVSVNQAICGSMQSDLFKNR